MKAAWLDSASFSKATEAANPDQPDLIAERMAALSSASLVDFDWRVQMVLGSSKVSGMNSQLLQLKFRIQEGGKEKEVLVELTKQELDALLLQMANTNKALRNVAV
eukprot:Rmarinus@m.927